MRSVIQDFEEALSQFTGAPHVACVDSCSNGIFLALKALEIKNTQIQIPDRTYVSVLNAILNSGNHPALKDEYWNKSYQLKGTPIYDYAVGFEPNCYVPGEVQVLSFQQKKSLPIGKGGAVLSDNKELIEHIRTLSFDGRDYSTFYRDQNQKYHVPAYHMNITPEQCAKGLLILQSICEGKRPISFKDSEDYPKLSVCTNFHVDTLH